MKTGTLIPYSSGKVALGGWSGFDRITSNMRTDDRQRRGELLNMGYGETRAFDRRACLTIRIAAVTHSPPEGFQRGLDAAEPCSRWRSHVLNKDEPAAGLKHSSQLGECLALIDNATQNQCADGVINGGGPDGQFVCRSGQKFDSEPQTSGLLHQVPIHERVWFHAYPADDLALLQMSEVGAGARADFKDSAGNLSKQLGLVRREVPVSLVTVPRHKPSENSKPHGPCAAADAGGIEISAFSAQSIDYYAIKGCPP